MVFAASAVDRVVDVVRWEPAAALLCASVAAFLTQAVLKRRLAESRNRLMAREFSSLWTAVGASAGLHALVLVLERVVEGGSFWLATVGFLAVCAWAVVAVRLLRVVVFEYLFASSPTERVPLLLVDIFTLALSLVLGAAVLHSIFLIEVTSILATSAVASIVLGLALQDTLGQLFAGISLQLDKPFRMGDWIEVRTGTDKVAGQVLEVSWRATMLMAMSEELITIPNKAMAQSQILNFSGRERPFIRGQLFRLPLEADLGAAKAALLEAAATTPGVLPSPAPLVLLLETTESWLAVKALYYCQDYGGHYLVTDAFLTKALALLAARGIHLASDRVEVLDERAPKLRTGVSGAVAAGAAAARAQ